MRLKAGLEKAALDFIAERERERWSRTKTVPAVATEEIECAVDPNISMAV